MSIFAALPFGETDNHIGLDYPYVTALLPNHTIEIHNLESQSIVQVVPLSLPPSPEVTSPSSFHFLVSSPSGYLVPFTQQTNKLKLLPVKLIPNPDGSGGPEVQPANKSVRSEGSPRTPAFPRAQVLLVSNSSLQCLLPSTIISQAEALLDIRRIEDAVDLAEQNMRKLLGNMDVDEDQVSPIQLYF